MHCADLAGVAVDVSLYRVTWGCQKIVEKERRGYVGVNRGVPGSGGIVQGRESG